MNLSEPRARVEMDSQVFDSFSDKSLFVSVDVKLRTGEASEAEFTVADENYVLLDEYSRAAGVPVVETYVWMGYGQEMGKPLFEGLLTGVSHGGKTTTFRFYDRSYAMRREQKTRYHSGLDLDVMKKLVTPYGLEFSGPGGSVKGLPLKAKKQEAQTDWEMLKSLAEEAGLVLFTRGRTLHAKPPARTAEPVITFSRRDAVLLDCDSTHNLPENVEGRPGSVEMRGRGKGGHQLSGVSDESQRGHKRLVINKSVKGASQSELTRRAQAKKELEREPAFTTRIRSLLMTNERADVRETIEMVERGLLFSGRYLVGQADYSFAPGSLTVDYDIYRDVA